MELIPSERILHRSASVVDEVFPVVEVTDDETDEIGRHQDGLLKRRAPPPTVNILGSL